MLLQARRGDVVGRAPMILPRGQERVKQAQAGRLSHHVVFRYRLFRVLDDRRVHVRLSNLQMIYLTLVL